jgi:hypothetical protein
MLCSLHDHSNSWRLMLVWSHLDSAPLLLQLGASVLVLAGMAPNRAVIHMDSVLRPDPSDAVLARIDQLTGAGASSAASILL